MLKTITMMNSAFLASLELDRLRMLAPGRAHALSTERTAQEEREADQLARELAADFPLHSMSELRRAIFAAEDEVSHKDPTHILERARDRVNQGILS